VIVVSHERPRTRDRSRAAEKFRVVGAALLLSGILPAAGYAAGETTSSAHTAAGPELNGCIVGLNCGPIRHRVRTSSPVPDRQAVVDQDQTRQYPDGDRNGPVSGHLPAPADISPSPAP
jgi:hypothetical protein